MTYYITIVHYNYLLQLDASCPELDQTLQVTVL